MTCRYSGYILTRKSVPGSSHPKSIYEEADSSCATMSYLITHKKKAMIRNTLDGVLYQVSIPIYFLAGAIPLSLILRWN